MGTCDLCGVEEELVEAIVEGALLSVCDRCSKHGEVIKVQPKIITKRVEKEKKLDIGPVKMVVDDYAELVRKAREKKGLKQKDLARSIGEKESTIHKVETSHLKPSLVLAKKFEVFLGVKLIGDYEDMPKKKIDFRDSNLTVGDLIRAGK